MGTSIDHIENKTFALRKISEPLEDLQALKLHRKLNLSGSRLGLGCFSASFISSFLTIVNHLLTNTYKAAKQIRNPLLYPTELRALNYLSACNIITSYASC
jgi:hypothetical protein